MKHFKFLFSLMALLLLMIVAPVMAQTDTGTTINDFGAVYGSLAALVAAIPIVVEIIKKFITKMPSWAVQLLSWFVGIAMTMFGWWMHLGFLDGIPWYLALAYGFGASLAANGIADTGLVQWLVGLFGKKVTEKGK